MTTTKERSAPKTRRATPKQDDAPASTESATGAKQPTKLDHVESLLVAPAGATIAELMAATGWQPHSVRGAISGALKKRGLAVASENVEGVRRYRASRPA